MAHADGFAGEQISVRIHGKFLVRGLGKDDGVASGRKGVIIRRSWANVQRDCGFYQLCWIFSRAFAASPRTRRSGSLLCAARTARQSATFREWKTNGSAPSSDLTARAPLPPDRQGGRRLAARR